MTEMIETIIAAVLFFAATNIDDLFINTLFFAQADTRRQALHVVLGKYAGIGALFLISLAGANALHALPPAHLNLLGIVPIALGVRAWLRREEDDSSCAPSASSGLTISTALVTIANGADNIGVYIPLLTSYSSVQVITTAAVFVLMIALWCAASRCVCGLPGLRSFLARYKQIIVPIVLISLGVYILV